MRCTPRTVTIAGRARRRSPGAPATVGPDARRGRPRARAGRGGSGRAPRGTRAAPAPARRGPSPRTPRRSRATPPSSSASRAAQHLAARAAVADRDRALHLAAHRRVVRDDDDRRAELPVGGAQRVEHLLRRRGVELAGRLVGQEQRAGALASATAIATRCCSPPDICARRRSAQCPTPSDVEQLARPRARGRARGRPASVSGQRDVLPRRSGTGRGCARSAARRSRPCCAGTRTRSARGHRHEVPARRPGPGRRSARRCPAAPTAASTCPSPDGADDRDHLARARRAGRGPAAPAPRSSPCW